MYPTSRYPLTHCIDRQNVARQCLEHSMFLWSLTSTLIVCAVFRTHVYLYNEFVGPFHVDREALAIHVNNYDQHFRWALRKEYFQVESSEGNIQNLASSAETIRRFSDPRTRQNHIATFKRVDRPAMYVKLPTPWAKYFHHRFPFNFRSFTTSTLRCLVKRLTSDSDMAFKQWISKAE